MRALLRANTSRGAVGCAALGTLDQSIARRNCPGHGATPLRRRKGDRHEGRGRGRHPRRRRRRRDEFATRRRRRGSPRSGEREVSEALGDHMGLGASRGLVPQVAWRAGPLKQLKNAIIRPTTANASLSTERPQVLRRGRGAAYRCSDVTLDRVRLAGLRGSHRESSASVTASLQTAAPPRGRGKPRPSSSIHGNSARERRGAAAILGRL